MLHHPLFRSAALPLVVTTGLLLLVLVIMLVTTHRSLARITPLQKHFTVISHIQEQLLNLQYYALHRLDSNKPISQKILAGLEHDINQLTQMPALLNPQSHDHVAQVKALLKASSIPSRQVLQQSITLLQEALTDEHRSQSLLLTNIQAQANLERNLSAVALVIIPMAAILVLFLLRRHFLLPLRNLNTLLIHLGERHFVSAPVEGVDPILEPLINNYNNMTERLFQLESKQRQHKETLETQVRVATRELLAHNRSLAKAERLAAVGEMAASLAHELRNPLAGVQMGLSNLQQECHGADIQARLDLMINEIMRVNTLMNALLNQARLRPEQPVQIVLQQLINDLLALIRYQIDEKIDFSVDIAEDINCILPENRLRQALLNLLINATQAQDGKGLIHIVAKLEQDRLILKISDQGPGFPDTLLHHGPRQFATYRGDGHGLGLASVRRLALDLGGELRLKNQDNGGAQVTLLLPCSCKTDFTRYS